MDSTTTASAAPSATPIPSLPTFDELGYHDPTDAQVAAAVNKVVRDTYDGQKATLERTPQGNLGYALRTVCDTSKVIIPDPVRLARILVAMDPQRLWCFYPSKDVLVYELYQHMEAGRAQRASNPLPFVFPPPPR